MSLGKGDRPPQNDPAAPGRKKLPAAWIQSRLRKEHHAICQSVNKRTIIAGLALPQLKTLRLDAAIAKAQEFRHKFFQQYSPS